MAGATKVLIRENFGKWFRTRGFLMVLAVALVPGALTAAWVGTHNADMAVTDLSFSPQDLTAGDNVTIQATIENVRNKAVDPFDVTIRVGFYEQPGGGAVRWRDVHNETVRIDGLAPREERLVTTTWTTQPGSFQVEVLVDLLEEKVPEVENLNNYRVTQMVVAYQSFRPDLPPPAPASNETNSTLPDAEVHLTALRQEPNQLFQDDNVTFHVSVVNDGPDAVTNATLTFQLYRLSATGNPTSIEFDQDETVALEPGAEQTYTFRVDRIAGGLYAAAAFLDASAASATDAEGNNVLVQQLDVQRRLIWEEPEEGATAKNFYRNEVLLPLHFTLLVPLIGLFFAGGALHDERSRGNLIYLLTRPVPRWSLPLTRFATGFAVALVAVLIGILVTYVLLLGTPRTDATYLWWPLVFGVLVLLVYSAVFTLLGVVTDRPYLVGLLYVLGFETLVLAGRRILVNGQPLVQDWVLNLSLMNWIQRAFTGWDPNAGFTLLPQGDEAVRAFLVLVGIAIVSLIGAMYAVQRRQFPE